MSATYAPSLNDRVRSASARLGADPVGAAREAGAILALAPGDPRALLILASARRRQGDYTGALVLLRPLAEAWPRAAHTHYELGRALAAQGDAAEAVRALRHAVALNSGLAEAWLALGEQLFGEGDAEGSRAAFARHDRATVSDPALAAAADAVLEGRVGEAEEGLRVHLTHRPNDAGALRLMAEVFARQRRYADAETLLTHAMALDPGHDGGRFALCDALFHQQKAAEAVGWLTDLLVHDPRNAAYQNLMAGCLGLLGEFDQVIGIYEDLLARYPRQPRIWLNHGHALRAVGRLDDAVGAYKRAIALAPGLGDAYWSLANLKVTSFLAEEEQAMAGQLARPELGDDDRLHLHYALGKALEDRGAYAASFEHYASGAAMARAAAPYEAAAATTLARRSETLFTRAFFEARAAAGSPAKDPIFIVGLPRAGSTLIEQILASHSAVEGSMELPDIDLIARALSADLGQGSGPDYPAILGELKVGRFAVLGDTYLERTRVHRRLERPHFIDKMPNNFQHLGLIHLILPNARIIDARRHPMGSCFSAFKQHFAQGQGFTYDLESIGRYYRDYLGLMRHFDRVLPGRVFRVIYEDLVTDTEAQVRRLLDYCALPFESACLRFHENPRAVRTVSSEQVRRPIYRDGLDQWRRYQPWLGALETALGPALHNWRGD